LILISYSISVFFFDILLANRRGFFFDVFVKWFESWLIHRCDMTRSYVWHDSFILICVKLLVHTCDVTHSMCVMTYSYVWHDSYVRVTWLILRTTWLIHMGDMTHSKHHDSITVWHNSRTRVHDSFIPVK